MSERGVTLVSLPPSPSPFTLPTRKVTRVIFIEHICPSPYLASMEAMGGPGDGLIDVVCVCVISTGRDGRKDGDQIDLSGDICLFPSSSNT